MDRKGRHLGVSFDFIGFRYASGVFFFVQLFLFSDKNLLFLYFLIICFTVLPFFPSLTLQQEARPLFLQRKREKREVKLTNLGKGTWNFEFCCCW